MIIGKRPLHGVALACSLLFFFTSRLRGEPARGVDDIHFTLGTPRAFFGDIALHF